MTVHGLHIETNTGFPAVALFSYVWCSCGWFQEGNPNTDREDYFKRVFLEHLRSLGTTARVDQP